jgi:hypothetical protein
MEYCVPQDCERREALARLLASRPLKRSPRLRQLLEFIAQGTFDANPETLKEHSIGVTIFGRRPGYNPADDNIVRVSVRQLRAKLQEYYQTDGRDEEWVAVIPKGVYVLRFESKTDAGLPEEAPSAGRTRFDVMRWAPWALALLLTAALAGLLLHVRALRSVLPRGPEKSLLGLLAPHAGQKLAVVVEDSGVQLYQRLTGRKVQMGTYADLDFLKPEDLPPELINDSRLHRYLLWSESTEFWSFPVLLEIVRSIPPTQLSLRYPRSLSIRDFQADNALLLGGPFANPWVQLFDRDLNFQIEGEPRKRIYIRNRDPRPGEMSVYASELDESRSTRCFARVAYLPNLAGRGKVLLAGGPHRASSEAAATFIAREDGLRQVMDLFQVNSWDQLPWLELLIEAKAVGTSAQTMRLLASRRVTVNRANPLKKQKDSQ